MKKNRACKDDYLCTLYGTDFLTFTRYIIRTRLKEIGCIIEI